MSGFYNKSFVSEQAAPTPKRIIVCCDGTWQSSVSLKPEDGVPSNVTRLCRVLAKAGTDNNKKVWQQVVYYDAGVGTGDHSWLGVQAKKEGGIGLGLLENVIEAYNFIVNNYSEGDELAFFGFSRGAFTARAAAGLVCTVGILKPNYMPGFIKNYAEYVKVDYKKRAKEFSEHPGWIEFVKSTNSKCWITSPSSVKIKVIGVWDTVGALGVPDMGHVTNIDNSGMREQYEFHNVELNDSIQYAYQALALDEQRKAFEPCVWKLKNLQEDKTKLCQCWFPGAHINVGGGSSANTENPPKGDREQLASISYAWMLDRIRPHLALDLEAYETQIHEFEALADKPLEPVPKEGWGAWLGRLVSRAPPPEGYGVSQIDDSHGWMYWAMSSPKPRTPAEYCNWETHHTGERIHPSVHFRQEANRARQEKVYEPIAMRGWERIWSKDLKGAGGKPRPGYMWVKYKDPKKPEEGYEKWLVEFEIADMPTEASAEKRLIDKSWVDVGGFREKVLKGWTNSG